MKHIRGKLDSGKYKGRRFISKTLDDIIILVEKGAFFNGSEMYAKFSRINDDFISDKKQ